MTTFLYPILWLLGISSLTFAILLFRDYGYSTLCIYLALLTHRISTWLLREGRRSAKRQDENREKVQKMMMVVDDEMWGALGQMANVKPTASTMLRVEPLDSIGE